MSHQTARILFWLPRILSILFAAFLSLFSLDVFNEARGFWHTAAALALHLIPTFIVLAALLLAWRREWIGAVLYVLAAVAYAWFALPRHPEWFALIGVPLLCLSALFLLDWLKRAEIRQARLIRSPAPMRQ